MVTFYFLFIYFLKISDSNKHFLVQLDKMAYSLIDYYFLYDKDIIDIYYIH